MKHEYTFMGKGYKYVQAITRLLGPSFTHEQAEDGITYFAPDGKRFVKLIDHQEELLVAFYVPIPMLHKDNRPEILHFHDAPVPYHEYRYRAKGVDEIYALIEIARENLHH